MERWPVIHIFPLTTLDSEMERLSLGGMQIFRPSDKQWFYLESSVFTDALYDHVVAKMPLFCHAPGSETTQPGHEARMLASAKGCVGRFVRALRLLHEGAIHDPSDFVSYSLVGSLNTIVSNAYDRASYSLRVRYRLGEHEVPCLEGIYRALAKFDALPTPQVSVAESLFNSSYSIGIQDPRDRTLLLLGSLESLLRTESVWQLSGLRWSNPQIPAFINEFRVMRNAIAHGTAKHEFSEPEILEEIVRVVLREALAIVIEGCTRITSHTILRRLKSQQDQHDLTADRLARLGSQLDLQT
jgi:hypothetical protein